MDVLVYLAGISLRSLGLAALAWLALRTFRVKSPSVKHAVWTMVTIAMLAQAAVSFWLPSIPLRVLSPVAIPAPRTNSIAIVLPPPVVQQHASASLSWSAILLVVYAGVVLVLLGRFVTGYFFTRSLLRSSISTALSTASGVAELRESTWISVPMTIGWLTPKILLPIAWREWDPSKLRAVLAHEEAHVRRADWVIGIVARLNCCLLWFHPLAWWLRRELAVQAEYACDDSALASLPGLCAGSAGYGICSEVRKRTLGVGSDIDGKTQHRTEENRSDSGRNAPDFHGFRGLPLGDSGGVQLAAGLPRLRGPVGPSAISASACSGHRADTRRSRRARSAGSQSAR